jgi:ribosomal protein S18 acetylase RimI-like enzyme
MINGLSRMSEYAVRTYQEADEVQLTSLFNECYQAYAGFVPRTLEYWRWCCLNRPDVENEGIIIVLHGGKIAGYAVVGKSGNIWELCFDRAHNGEPIVSLILEKAIEYLARVGSDAATLNLPRDDSITRKACEKLGFSMLAPDPKRVFLSVLEYEQFVRFLASANKKKLTGLQGDFVIRLKDARSWMSPFISIGLGNGRIETGRENRRCDVLIETDTSTLASMLLGTYNPSWALLRFRLKIHPLRKLRRALRLFSLLRLDDSWFFPRADLG